MASSLKMVELRPNRDLLDVNFAGYKLSLEPIASYQQFIDCGVDNVLPSDQQYSYLHLKVFSLHNHLYGDPWFPEDVYFIDKTWRIQRNFLNPQTGHLEGVKQVWEIPASRHRQTGHYNPSLSFPNSEMALIADGTGFLHVIVTGVRNKCQNWEVVYSGEMFKTPQSFVIADSSLFKDVDKKRLELHCLLMWIEEMPSTNEISSQSTNCTIHNRTRNFQSALNWVVFTEVEGGNWSILRSYHLNGPGEIHYIALETNCTSLYVASEEIITFIENSENNIESPMEEIGETVQEENVGKKRYMWQQTMEDIEITFNIGENIQKGEIVVKVNNKHLRVLCRGNVLLEGDLWGCTDPNLNSWTLEGNKLQITLFKVEPGLMWQYLVPNDSNGEEVVDPALVEEIHQRLSHLCSDKVVTDTTHTPTINSEQLEECDTGQTNSILMRLDPVKHSVTHQASLGGHQALFCTRTCGSQSLALCLRHDVDGCVWQPSAPKTLDNSEWPIVHIGTFHAFGYVQASKQQRKFTVCAPNLSYVAVCDASRHVYIYRQLSDVQGSLRNRKTGQKVERTAQQQLFSLSDSSEIMGAHAGNNCLFILTENYILALHVNPREL